VSSQAIDRHVSCSHLAQERQANRAIRLNDQLAANLLLGALRRPGLSCVGSERLNANLIAHLQLIRKACNLARQTKHEGNLIVDANPVLRHMCHPRMADILALGERLPIDLAAGLPGHFALTTGSGTVDAPNWMWRRRTKSLTQFYILPLDNARWRDKARRRHDRRIACSVAENKRRGRCQQSSEQRDPLRAQ
jgi:hypothetical protein